MVLTACETARFASYKHIYALIALLRRLIEVENGAVSTHWFLQRVKMLGLLAVSTYMCLLRCCGYIWLPEVIAVTGGRI
ncbi:hypothetical protein [Paenibacillus sp. NRS-1760]|uniref:hypothetical protein n=1 Tax=Paenibacillus sp. NRS-1760 TaxID=3233902 RepID=UPI003D26BCA6